jgi:hypothetical protein
VWWAIEELNLLGTILRVKGTWNSQSTGGTLRRVGQFDFLTIKRDSKMNQKLSIKRLFLISTILMNLICLNSNLLSNSQASKGSPQEQITIPEISTPKIENMIDVGGRKLHCCVYGNGSPTVVLVSGLEAP